MNPFPQEESLEECGGVERQTMAGGLICLIWMEETHSGAKIEAQVVDRQKPIVSTQNQEGHILLSARGQEP